MRPEDVVRSSRPKKLGSKGFLVTVRLTMTGPHNSTQDAERYVAGMIERAYEHRNQGPIRPEDSEENPRVVKVEEETV